MRLRSLPFWVLILFFGCSGTKSNDKHPELPYLRDIIIEKYNGRKIQFEYSNQIQNFLLRQAERWPEDSLTVFDLISGQLITFPIKGARAYVDELQHYIYTNLNDSVFFRYGPPAFDEEFVELKYFRSSHDSVARQNLIRTATEVDTISDSIYNAKLRTRGFCMTMFWDHTHYLLRGAGQDFVIRYTGPKLDLPQCAHVMPSEEFPSNFLKPFDEAVLEYVKTGYHSNLFGEAVKLYYYKVEIGSSTILFKDYNYFIRFYRTTDHRLLLIFEANIFEFKDR